MKIQQKNMPMKEKMGDQDIWTRMVADGDSKKVKKYTKNKHFQRNYGNK